MNLRDLRYLTALAEHRHFGRAARVCFVSQPTLSAQIKKLEDELGVVLFERGPRRLLVTAAGAAIAERARHILDEVEQIRRIARASGDPEAGMLRLGQFPTLGPYLLPHIVPLLHRQFPHLELMLYEEKTAEIIARLKDGRLDAGLLALPVNVPGLCATALFTEPFRLAVPAGHRLAQRRRVAVSELAGERLLLLEEGHCLRDHALEVCELAGAAEHEDFRATSLETLRQMVVAGSGMTLLPELAIAGDHADPSLSLLNFTRPPPHRQIALVRRQGSVLEPLLVKIAELIAAVAGELLKK